MRMRLYQNVKNLQELLNSIKTIKATLLDASKIIDQVLLQVALFKAQNVKNKTKSIYSEIVYNISPTTSILDSFKLFGLNSDTRHVIVISSDEQDLVDGQEIPIEELKKLRDLKIIQDIYNIHEQDPEKLLNLICGTVALKGL